MVPLDAMKMTFLYGLTALFLTIALGGCSRPPEAAPEAQEHAPLVVFLVRHGEKVDASGDPELSPAGQERAATLATVLKDASLGQVHSSDYIRTRDTAAPSAAAHGLEVQLYDPRDLPALATRLRAAGGRHLVVGHSNTTPALVELLGGRPGSEIDEPAEYDRLYIVTIGKDGASSSVLLRYGTPYIP